jgi:opacity protein-like surface antigen
MKIAIRSLIVTCAGCAVTAFAQGYTGPYLKADAGPTFTEDVTIREFLGLAPGSNIEFDPGFRFSAGGGYVFSDIVAIGGETGFSWNNIENIEGASSESDSSIGNVPLLGTITLKLPNKTGLVPFIGAGGGVSFTFFNADSLVVPDNLTPGTVVLDGSESDTVFAWQLTGGLKYQINEQMSLGVAYKYFRAESPRWEAEDDFGVESDLRTGDLETHSVSFVFNMKF